MDSKNADIQNAQADLLRLLVAKTLQKYGVTTERPSNYFLYIQDGQPVFKKFVE